MFTKYEMKKIITNISDAYHILDLGDMCFVNNVIWYEPEPKMYENELYYCELKPTTKFYFQQTTSATNPIVTEIRHISNCGLLQILRKAVWQNLFNLSYIITSY